MMHRRHENGMGCQADESVAVYWYERAAMQGTFLIIILLEMRTIDPLPVSCCLAISGAQSKHAHHFSLQVRHCYRRHARIACGTWGVYGLILALSLTLSHRTRLRVP